LEEGRNSLLVFIPASVFAQAMALESGEDIGVILSHTIFGLEKEGLIGPRFAFGNPEYVKQLAPDAEILGLVVGPSALGVELFLWANGRPHVPATQFFDPAVALEPLPDISIQPGSFPSSKPKAGV
jgi:hypothetical protein